MAQDVNWSRLTSRVDPRKWSDEPLPTTIVNLSEWGCQARPPVPATKPCVCGSLEGVVIEVEGRLLLVLAVRRGASTQHKGDVSAAILRWARRSLRIRSSLRRNAVRGAIA